MFIMDARDPTWTGRVMAELFAHATRTNLEPHKWRLGVVNMRDVLRARNPDFSNEAYERPETMWGADVEIVALGDVVELVAFDKGAPHDRAFKTLVPR
jgi:hypothetical protein